MKKKQAKTSKKKEIVVKEKKTPEYRETVKFNNWCKAFLDPKSKTHGNAVQSALATYNTTSYRMAGVIGSDNLKKLKGIGMIMIENEGISYKEFMKIGLAKMLKGDFDTWERFGTHIGYLEPAVKNPVLNQFNFNLGEEIAKARKERGLE